MDLLIALARSFFYSFFYFLFLVFRLGLGWGAPWLDGVCCLEPVYFTTGGSLFSGKI